MNKAKSKKLSLSRETVRQLDTKRLSKVAGGLPPPRTEVRSICICGNSEWC